ncbi:MAG: 2' O-ribose methyltransferase, partial [Ramalina farinacea]|nr:2' O-ribose methyltransferase [Ramalina farinacea]
LYRQGYAPGSWSQVAVDRTFPNGRVVGIDIIPALPPKGVSTIQGNFLAPSVQAEVKNYLLESDQGKTKRKLGLGTGTGDEMIPTVERDESSMDHTEAGKKAAGFLPPDRTGQQTGQQSSVIVGDTGSHVVDVILSDMSEPWAQTDGFWKRSLSNPYYRMMNTSGMPFRDHAGSMDLCNAALTFARDVLRTGGHFVCKFYQGAEDKNLEEQLKQLFSKVHREKPESSRGESKESYFVALRRKS